MGQRCIALQVREGNMIFFMKLRMLMSHRPYQNMTFYGLAKSRIWFCT